MKHLTPLLSLLLAVVIPVSVIAQPRVIGDLSDGALLGEIRDTAQLQHDFTDHQPLLAQASRQLGLSQVDFEEVAADIARGRAQYVEIPRRLDGMAGQHAGSAFAVHNVLIPAHTFGWEVDLERPAGIVRVFMPNRCGNISYLTVPRHQTVAAAVPSRSSSPVPTAAPEITPAPETTAAPATTAIAPEAVALPTSAPAPAAHHFALLPWIALGLIGIAFMHGGGGNVTGAPVHVVPVVATPIPVHTICPAAVIYR